MIDVSRIDQLAARLTAALPPRAQQFGKEVEAQFRTILRRGLESIELVTREEFEIQKAALERAAVKLKALEQRLDELEAD